MLSVAIILFFNVVLSCNRMMFCKNTVIFIISGGSIALDILITLAVSIALVILIVLDITITHGITIASDYFVTYDILCFLAFQVCCIF